MITSEEIKFIYDNWKVNQYLEMNCWGKNHENARPEYYLALKRDVKFRYKDNCIYYKNIKNKNVSEYTYIDGLCLEWSDFLQYSSRYDYIKHVLYKKTALKKHIMQLLETALVDFSVEKEITRLYIL